MAYLSITPIFEFLAALATLGAAMISALLAPFSCIFSLAGIGIAAYAALQAARAANETRQNTQAQVASTLLDQYASAEMRKDMKILRKWHWLHHNNSRGREMYLRQISDEDKEDADQARRHLAHYFQKAAILAHHKLIDRHLLKDVISENQVRFASKYVEPLDVGIAEQETHVTDPHWAYNQLRLLHNLSWVDETTPPNDAAPAE